MEIAELRNIIESSGGRSGALEYADTLLKKVNRLEATARYEQLFKQLRGSREQGDLRGRVLEVNFADQFHGSGQELTYGPRQDMTGDIDFLWHLAGLQIFIEMKLLRQDKESLDSMSAQLETGGVYSSLVTDDTRDIARIQLDLITKSSTRKFNPVPKVGWINLVAIDVTELQLGMVDVADCVLAAAGNAQVAAHYSCDSYARPNVVGLFERPSEALVTKGQRNWVTAVHRVPSQVPHPRDYIHGALFLFREPKDTAALSYELRGVVVWNSLLVTMDQIRPLQSAIQRLLPYPHRPEKHGD